VLGVTRQRQVGPSWYLYVHSGEQLQW
jgi:hypothetical protein